MSEEIKSQLKGVRTGNYPIVCADHTLVLNWNHQTTSLLRKIAQNSHGCGKSMGRWAQLGPCSGTAGAQLSRQTQQ